MTRRSTTERRLPAAFLAGALALASAACGDPASLRVNLEIKEPNLGLLELRITRRPGADGTLVARCLLPSGERASGDCPLENGSQVWSGGSELSFVLYGRPKTPVEIRVIGRRSRDGTGPTITSTTARVELPAKGGEAGTAKVALASRTGVRFRCKSIELGPDLGVPTDRSAVTLFGPNEILATTAGRLARLRYEETLDGCTITSTELLDACRVYDNSLVAAPAARTGRSRIVAGLCNNIRSPGAPANTTVELFAGLDAGDDKLMFQWLSMGMSGLGRAQISRPVLADPFGTGSPEVVFFKSAMGGLVLSIWDPRDPTGSTIDLPLPGLTPFGNNVFNGPMAARLKDPPFPDALLIASYPGGIGIVTGNPPEFQLLHADRRSPLMSPGAAVIDTETGISVLIATLYNNPKSMSFTTIEENGGVWHESDSFALTLPRDFELAAANRDVRVALGDIDGTGRLTAVIVQNGRAILFPAEREATIIVRNLWNGTISGVQSVLLADIDGRPGANVIAFDPQSPLLNAIDSEGRQLDGWPIQALEGGQLRMFVTHLDRRRPDQAADSLELVTMSRRIVEVISLGLGTYNRGQIPWPAIYRDSRGSGAIGPSARDPDLLALPP